LGRREDIEAELALQDRAVERHERKIAKAIKDAMLQVATELRATLNPDLPFDHFRRIEEAMGDLYRDVTRSIAASMIDRFKSGFEHLETKDDNDGFYERIWQEYLNQYGGTRIAQISETTRRQIVALIDKGLRDGLSLDEIAGEIRMRAPDMSALRAHTIARTETHSASMYASLQSAKQSTVELLKEWVSVEDSRTRDFGEGDGVVDFYDHRSMNGVKVPIDDPFEVPNKLGGSEKLMFPGDPAGSAANIINCRCGQVYVDTDEDEVEDDVEITAAPVQRNPGGEFLYRTVKDPEPTKEGVYTFIKDHELFDVADLDGLNAKKLAPLMRHFLEVKERFDMDPLAAIGPGTRFGTRKGAVSRANAAMGYNYQSPFSKNGGLFHMPTHFTSDARYAKQYNAALYWSKDGKYTSKRAGVLAKSRNINNDVKTRAQQMDQEGVEFTWTVSALESDAQIVRRRIIYHEMGHALDLVKNTNADMGRDLAAIKSTRPTCTGWGYIVSEYSTSNGEEYVAESFALYMTDTAQHYRIHPDLLQIFRKYDKAHALKSAYLGAIMSQKQAIEDDILHNLDPTQDAVALIREMIAHPEQSDELIKAYKGGDLDLIGPDIEEALFTAQLAD